MKVNAVILIGFGARLARLGAAALGAALLAGCNLLSVGYGHLDTYAAWQAAEYFDLDTHQRQEFKARFDRLHEWHRTEQLPDYAKFLAASGARVRSGVTSEDGEWIARGIEDRYRALMKRSADDAAAILMTLTPANMEALQRRWAKDNARYAREHKVNGSPAEQQQARTERELKRIREWAGELTAGQEKKIAALAADLPLAPKLRYEDRLRRQREFVQLMASRGTDQRQFAERLRRFLAGWEEGRSPEFARFAAEWRRRQVEFYVEVARLLTPQQRAVLVNRVERYASDFTQLAQR
jgi:hypothetical protein